jgi:uncharacterized protein (TIGR03435 family)
MNVFLSALINGVILSVFLTGVAWLALRLISRTSLNAATRYVGLWVLLVIVLLLPALCLPRHTISAPLPVSDSAAPQIPIAEPVVETPAIIQVQSNPARTRFIPFAVPEGRWSATILIAWSIAALIMLLRLTISWIILERRKVRSLPPPEHFADRAGAWMDRCHSTRKVTLRVASADIGGPMATGPWNPSILFPARFFDEFPEDEIDQIGLHEAAHLARHDDYALTMQRIIEACFFWHPAVQWITRQINLEREIACDDFVIQLTGDPRVYASCLTRVAELTAGIRPSLAAAAVTDESSHLATRVEMLLDKTRHTGTRLLRVPLSAGFAALVFLAGMATELPVLFSPVLTVAATPVSAKAQIQASPPAAPAGRGVPAIVTAGPAAPGTPGSLLPKAVRPANAPTPPPDGGVNAELKSAPRFTTATITPVEWHMGGVSEKSEPGKTEYKMVGIKRLFFLAWPMEYYRFVWPDWLAESNGNINAWYDISVTMPADTTAEQLQLMIRGLLADRFKMSAHWETRNTDIYAVKIAPGGIKFQKSTDPSNPGYKGIGSPDGWHAVPRLPRQGPGTGSGMTLAQFTQSGSFITLLDRPMVDMTGLEGVYDIDLYIPRDPSAPMPMQPLNGPSTAAERAKNNGFRYSVYFEEVEKQLGLTVSPETVPVKMLVVDDLDVVPTSN